MNKKTKKYLFWVIAIVIIITIIFFLRFYEDVSLGGEARCLERINKEISEKGILSFLKKPECPLEIAAEAASISSVSDYFTCKSIVDDDLSICNKLMSDIPDAGYEKMRYKPETHFRICKDFNLFFANFINRIEKEQECNKEIINYCLEFIEVGEGQSKEKKCQDFCRAYLEKNSDFCTIPPKTNVNTLDKNECLALITGDKEYCEELKGIAKKQCISAIQYLSITKSGNKEECDLIDTEPLVTPGVSIHPAVPNFRMLCDLFFDRNIEICEKELDIFKRDYCRNK